MGVTLTHLKESRRLILVQWMCNWKITIYTPSSLKYKKNCRKITITTD